MNDTREIMTLDDLELDTVSGGTSTPSFVLDSYNHQTQVVANSNTIATGGNKFSGSGTGGNAIETLQVGVNLGLQAIGNIV
jgi:hypothetical protein